MGDPAKLRFEPMKRDLVVVEQNQRFCSKA